VIQAWYKNRNNRINWHLHDIQNEIVELAGQKKLLIVLENLKNVKTGVNKRGLRMNKANGKLQLHRKLPRYMLGRLNR
jgi:IS605 OrfB family transposase